MVSYWEHQNFLHYDHIVIGAGIVGLHVAIELKERFPKSRVLVLERGLLTTGATSRNAGFACMGSITELLDDLQHTHEDDVVQLFQSRKNGLDKLRKRLGDNNIGYTANGSYELINEQETDAIDKIDYLNTLLLPITGKAAFQLANEKIDQFGFSKNYTKSLIENTGEGEVNTGMLLRTLTDLSLRHGIDIRTGAEVLSFEESTDSVTLRVSDPFRKEEWQFSSSTLSICTNAFTNKLLPDAGVRPGRGQVLVTKPIQCLKFKGIFHFDKGYYYFREINGRVLFGGGRNLDIEGEATTDFALNDRIQNNLEQKLKEIILPCTPFEIDMRWTGIMAFGTTKSPVVKALTNRVFAAYRMGGMGVALAAEVASEMGQMIEGSIS